MSHLLPQLSRGALAPAALLTLATLTVPSATAERALLNSRATITATAGTGSAPEVDGSMALQVHRGDHPLRQIRRVTLVDGREALLEEREQPVRLQRTAYRVRETRTIAPRTTEPTAYRRAATKMPKKTYQKPCR